MKVYIAGPMRGQPDFNFPAFDAAKKLGESLGHEIVSPADMDRAQDRFDGIGKTGLEVGFWGPEDVLRICRRDCAALQDCDAIALLPGWEKSTGATAEAAIARWLKIPMLDARTFASLGELPSVEQGVIKNGDFVLKDSGERTVFGTGAQRDMQAGKGYFHLIPFYPMERLAKLYEAGATKYGPNNWKKGIPLFAYINSAFRHLYKLNEGHMDEDHAAALMWNVVGYIWTQKEIEEGRMSKGLLELTLKLSEEYLAE